MKYRLDMSRDEIDLLEDVLYKAEDLGIDISGVEFVFSRVKVIEESYKKKFAAHKATAARSSLAKTKVQDAVNTLLKEGKEVTPYQVSKLSGVAYATARKYINII